MLNIAELEKQFDEILNAFTAKDLEEWLAFAEEREKLEKLHKGEMVTLKLNIHQIVTIVDTSIEAIEVAGNYSYAMAA